MTRRKYWKGSGVQGRDGAAPCATVDTSEGLIENLRYPVTELPSSCHPGCITTRLVTSDRFDLATVMSDRESAVGDTHRRSTVVSSPRGLTHNRVNLTRRLIPTSVDSQHRLIDGLRGICMRNNWRFGRRGFHPVLTRCSRSSRLVESSPLPNTEIDTRGGRRGDVIQRNFSTSPPSPDNNNNLPPTVYLASFSKSLPLYVSWPS